MVIAFDLDDTLYFEHDFLESGLKAVAHELQRQGILESHEAVRILHSKPTPAECIDALVDVINRLHGEGYITVAEILRIYRSPFPSIALRDGAVALLRELQSPSRSNGLPHYAPKRIHSFISATTPPKISIGQTKWVGRPSRLIIKKERPSIRRHLHHSRNITPNTIYAIYPNFSG